jgi:FKBP-type peptidyl-prolyl cis-trans isomerase SlyD
MRLRRAGLEWNSLAGSTRRRRAASTERVFSALALGSSMNIFTNTVVTLTFELFDAEGALLEATDEPITYLHGGHSGMLPKLEEALSLKRAGDAVSVDIEPADGFGDYDPGLVKLEPADRLPPEVEVGMQFEAYTNPGDKQGSGTVFTVTDIAEGKVVLDGNHPWAGKRLRFECQILDVRAATAEEVEHGHVHGAGGHHH